jgi:DNA polymerase-1
MTRDGILVNAAYGFTTIFLKVIKELKPTYVAVAFDRKEPTFRHEVFKEYKAQREKKPRELYNQIAIIKDIVDAFGVPVFEVKGYEADDVIGTITAKVKERGIDSLIVTGDLDTLQLVDNTTSVYTLRKGMSDTVIYDPRLVKERYGLTPDQLIDFKTLRGDPSDNIPGIRGIGEKTAAELIAQFGSLKALYLALKQNDQSVKQLPARLREILQQGAKDIALSQKLVTIVRDVPLRFNLDDCRLRGFNLPKIADLFHKLEFKTLLARLPELSQKLSLPEPTVTLNSAKQAKGKYALIDSNQALSDLLKELAKAKELAIDTETSGLNARQDDLVGIAISMVEGEGYFIPATLAKTKAWTELANLLAKNQVGKILHNAKFDIHALRHVGLKMRGLTFDTLLAAYLLKGGERVIDLKSLVYQEFGVAMTPITELIGTKGKNQKTMNEVSLAEVAKYAAADADYTLRLKQKFASELEHEGMAKLFYDVEVPLVEVLADMEEAGVKIDSDYLVGLAKKMRHEVSQLEKEIYKQAGAEFNIASPKQLKAVLFNTLKISPEGLRHTKTGISTAAAELEKMRGLHPIIDYIFAYRELTKLLSTYVEALPQLIEPNTGRVHSSFNQTVTATGRLSSSDPNLQNIPVRGEWGPQIRRAFIAEQGYALLSADYSQIDLRVAAHLSQDARMIEVFNKGMDVHAATASFIFGVPQNKVTPDQRRTAKEVNFGILYGMGAYGLAERTNLNRSEAQDFIKRYFQSFAKLKEWLEEVKREARKTGEVRTLFGRKRKLPEINSGVQQVRAAAERMAINLPVQGTAADIMKIAMVQVAAKLSALSPKTKMIMQVHDELIFEVPQKEITRVAELVRAEMSGAVKLKVPVVVDVKVGKNWAELEEI